MALTKPAVGSTGWGNSINQNWSDIEAAFNSLSQGRLTLTSGTPVTTSNVTGASTIYFTPYNGAWTALYDGTNWKLYNFSEISLALSGLTSGKNYDVFLYNNSGTLTLILGPAWSSDTSRGTGAGTTELVLQDGVWVNKQDISGGPTAKKGRYLGTIHTTGTTTTEDSDNQRFVWNVCNRVPRPMKARDTTDSWVYTTNTWRSANNSTTVGTARTQYVCGLSIEPVKAEYNALFYNASGPTNSAAGIGIDSTSSNSAITFGAQVPSNFMAQANARYWGYPGIGYHFIQSLETGNGTGSTWYGDFGASYVQSGQISEVWS